MKKTESGSLPVELGSVHEFWNVEACGTHFIAPSSEKKNFYEKFREFRDQTEWHIPLLVPFQEMKGKKVLEIGCGNGADGVRFAQAGAQYTGVDLTEAAVRATQDHFSCLNLSGTFQTENAQSLSFPDQSFDVVYSHGVLHHTPVPQKAFDEVFRVLRPGGQAIIMLYHKNSFNYYIRIMFFIRVRALIYTMARLLRWPKDRQKLHHEELVKVRGNENPKAWQAHYENFLLHGFSYFKAENFVHRCTDGPMCPYAFVYSASDARKSFSKFSSIRTAVAHFPLRKYSILRWIPFGIEKWLASTVGWYLFIFANKK